MSRSPHRFRGDAAECWQLVLFGEVLRALDRPARVKDDPLVKLPKSGHWETGLAKIRPSLDDALGSTAFAVAWRWACAEANANAWPGVFRVAKKALDAGVSGVSMDALADAGGVVIDTQRGPGRSWIAQIGGQAIVVRSSDAHAAQWGEVDRIASILAAWLDVPFRIE